MTYAERIKELQSQTTMDIEAFCKCFFKFSHLAKGEAEETLEEKWQEFLREEEKDNDNSARYKRATWKARSRS